MFPLSLQASTTTLSSALRQGSQASSPDAQPSRPARELGPERRCARAGLFEQPPRAILAPVIDDRLEIPDDGIQIGIADVEGIDHTAES